MKITAQELIDELKKLPPDREIEFLLLETKSWGAQTLKGKFDRVVHSTPAQIELVS